MQACLRAGVEVVLMSGRRRAQLAEDARLLGQRSYIYEAGACVVLDGEEHWLTGNMQPGELTIAQQIERSGAPALLLEHYAGRLEHHDPWHTEREVSHLFRGLVDAGEADRVLAEHDYEGLRLVDNGAVSRRSPALAAVRRGYHLVPAGAPRGAVAFYRRARGYEREQTFGSDSREIERADEGAGPWCTLRRATPLAPRPSPPTPTCASASPPTARASTRRS